MLVTMPANVEKRKPHFARKKQKRKPPAKGSTVPEEKRPPHLIADGTLKRCSACGYPRHGYLWVIKTSYTRNINELAIRPFWRRRIRFSP